MKYLSLFVALLKRRAKILGILGIVLVAGGFALSSRPTQAAEVAWLSRNCHPMRGSNLEQWRRVSPFSPERNYFNILSIGCYLSDLRTSIVEILNNTNQILSIVRNQDRNQTSCTTPRTGRQVVLQEIQQCVDSCVLSSIEGMEGEEATGNVRNRLLSSQRFATCISRCSSNTSNNYECARRFSDLTGDYHPDDIVQNDAASSRILTGSVAQCLFNQEALQCQRRCDAALTADVSTFSTQYRTCLDRCPGGQGIVRIFSDVSQRDLTDDAMENFIKGNMGTEKSSTEAILSSPEIRHITPAPAPKTETESVPSCSDSCALERMSCVKQAQTSKAMSLCTDAEAACRVRCSEKR